MGGFEEKIDIKVQDKIIKGKAELDVDRTTLTERLHQYNLCISNLMKRKLKTLKIIWKMLLLVLIMKVIDTLLF